MNESENAKLTDYECCDVNELNEHKKNLKQKQTPDNKQLETIEGEQTTEKPNSTGLERGQRRGSTSGARSSQATSGSEGQPVWRGGEESTSSGAEEYEAKVQPGQSPGGPSHDPGASPDKGQPSLDPREEAQGAHDSIVGGPLHPVHQQVIKTPKNSYNDLTALIRSDDARSLERQRVEACEGLIDPDPAPKTHGKGRRGSGEDKRPTGKWYKPRTGMVMRAQGVEGEGLTLEVEEVADSPASAWTVTRNFSSTTTLLTLVDTGNQAVSCMPLKLFKHFCNMEQRGFELEEYKAPVVGVGSMRIKVYGRLKQPITLYFEGCESPIKVRPILINSKANHLNVGIRELSDYGVTLHLSRETGNWLQKNNSWIQLHSKKEAIDVAQSSDPDFLLAHVNSAGHSNTEELSEARLMQRGQAERKLRCLANNQRVLCKTRGIYHWSDPRSAIGDPSPTKEEKNTSLQKDEMSFNKHFSRILKENRDPRTLTPHLAKPLKSTSIPARTFLYVPCRTSFPYGTTFFCAPLPSQELPLLAARCVMVRNSPASLVYIPIYNLTDADVEVKPNDVLASLEAGEVEHMKEAELMPGREGEFQKCGDFSFPVTVKSEQGHEWLPPEGGNVPRLEQGARENITFLPNFTKSELDEIDKTHKEEYQVERHPMTKEEESLPEEKKVKMRDALAELERLPRQDGEWIRGELRKLGDTEEAKMEEKPTKKLLIEEASEELVQELFEAKLKLDENKYINQFPPKVQKEMKKAVISMLMEQRSAFSAGEEGNPFAEQVGLCSWFEYQLVLKPIYRDTIFYQKPKALSKEDTEALRTLLEDWMGKGLIRKNNPTKGKEGSPHSLPLFLVKKKTTSGSGMAHRAILDARKLNNASIHRQVYMGSVQQNLASLEKADIYTNLDIASFFNSIKLSETPAKGHIYSSVDYCSFQTHSLGSFSFLRAAQGVHQSTSLASWIMDRLSRDFSLDVVRHFADDILIVAKDDPEVKRCLERKTRLSESAGRGENAEESRRESRMKIEEKKREASLITLWREKSAGGKMIETLRLLLERIKEAGLRLQLKKCEWFCQSITWLGFQVSSRGIQIPEKLKKELLEEKPPRTPASLANWLGRLLYFRRHILGLSHFSARLHEAAVRPPKDWRLTGEELQDWLLLRRAFLESTAIGFVDYDNLDKHKLKVFLDWSALGLSALVTQTQTFFEGGNKIEKEVLVGSISRKCPPSLRNATSCRGEAAALTLALSSFTNILKSHHFLLHSDHLSLLYLKGLKSMNGQLWRLFEEIAKYSFTMIHVRHCDNGLADANSRRTNLPELTKEEADLFGDIIEELGAREEDPYFTRLDLWQDLLNERLNSDLRRGKAGLPPDHSELYLPEDPAEVKQVIADRAQSEKRKKGEPRRRNAMTKAQEFHVKKQQLKLIRYAKLLNQGDSPRQDEADRVEELINVEGGLILDPHGGERRHHRGNGVETASASTSSLRCPGKCEHQPGWLPRANDSAERVCVSRNGEENCKSRDDWSLQKLEEVDGDQEDGAPDNPLLRAVGGKLRGHVEDAISPEEIVQKQKADPILGQIYEFVRKGSWPTLKVMREQFFHPEIIKYFNLKEVLELDDLGVICRRRVSPEIGRELKICLPESLREVVFQTCHLADKIHRALETTAAAISERFFYLHMNADLRARILRCGSCFTAKLPAPKGNARMPQLHSVLLQGCCDFNHTIACDTSGRLPACRHNPPHRYFALMVDSATGFVVTKPMVDKTAGSMVHVFTQGWLASFHAPTVVRLDRGSEFVNKAFLSMLESSGIQPVFTMVGAARALYAERKNRDVKQTLRAVLSTCQDQAGWCTALPYITASLNATLNKNSGFSAYKLVFGKDPSTPLSNLICVPKKAKGKPIALQDPGDALLQHAATREKDLDRLKNQESFDPQDEVDKSKARIIMFSKLRDNRILSLSRSADCYSNHTHPLFPLRNSEDKGKLVYIFTDRVPRGKSQSLTSKWVGPAKIDLVISNILAVVTTMYRQQRFGRPETTQAYTIDRLYPFHSDHKILCSADSQNPQDLVSTVNVADYQPNEGEMNLPEENTEEDDEDDNNVEILTNDFAEAAHALPDEFCEAPRANPDQQIDITQQQHIKFQKTWDNVLQTDERLLLNDIITPGTHGEKWQTSITRSALADYMREVSDYEENRLKPDIDHEFNLDKQHLCSTNSSKFSVPSDTASDDADTTSGETGPDIVDNDEHDDDDDNNPGNDGNDDGENIETQNGKSTSNSHPDHEPRENEATQSKPPENKEHEKRNQSKSEEVGKGPTLRDESSAEDGLEEPESSQSPHLQLTPVLPGLEDGVPAAQRREVDRRSSRLRQQLLSAPTSLTSTEPEKLVVSQPNQPQPVQLLDQRHHLLGRGQRGQPGALHSQLPRAVLPYHPQTYPRPATRAATESQLPRPRGRPPSGQPGTGEGASQVPRPQNILHSVEGRGSRQPPSTDTTVGSRWPWQGGKTKQKKSIWKPIDWAAVNRQAQVQVQAHQRVADQSSPLEGTASWLAPTSPTSWLSQPSPTHQASQPEITESDYQQQSTKAPPRPRQARAPGGFLQRAVQRLAGANRPGLLESDAPLGRTRSQKPKP